MAANLDRFQQNLKPVLRPEMRQNKSLEYRFGAIGAGNTLAD